MPKMIFNKDNQYLFQGSFDVVPDDHLYDQ